jgi:thioredoxin 2
MTTTRSDIVPCENCGTKNRVPASATGVPKCAKCATALPWVTEAGDDDFDDIATSSKVPVLVDLWAEWCPPCRMVSPILDQLAKARAGQLKLVKVNVDNSPTLARRYDARSIPTLLLIAGGEVVGRQVGALPAHALQSWVDGALAGTR